MGKSVNRKTMVRQIRNLVLIAIASAIYAVGISLFLDPNNLAPGGITGISVIVNRLTGIETGTLYFLLNIPVMLLGIWKFGWKFMAKTAYSIFLTSVFTNCLSGYDALTDDPLLAAVAGGTLMAVGIGTIFRAGATTGGTDIIIKVLRQKYRYLKTGFLFQCSDMIVVALSGIVFQNLNIMLYALITVFLSGRVLDYVLYGGDEARMVYIITTSPDEIAERIMDEVEAGLTYLEGKGGWTGQKKQVILCVVRKRQAPLLEELVKDVDSSAFMIITARVKFL